MFRSLYISMLLGSLTPAVFCQASNINARSARSNSSVAHFETWKMTGNWTQYAPPEFLQLYPDFGDDNDAGRFETTQRVAAQAAANGAILGNPDANPQGFRTKLDYSIRIVGYIAGNIDPWIQTGKKCYSGSGDAYPYSDCVGEVGQEVAALCASIIARDSDPGLLAVAFVHKAVFYARKFTSGQRKQNKDAKKGSNDDGHDEVKRVRETGPDTCVGTSVYAQYTTTTYDPDHTFKATSQGYCEGLSSSITEDVISAVMDAWINAGRGERVAYTAYDTGTGNVALRGVVDIIPPYENPQECPADIPGDQDGCTCVNC